MSAVELTGMIGPGRRNGVSVPVGGVVAKHPFALKDNRYDPLVGVALIALAGVVDATSIDRSACAVIAVTASGCLSHLSRVVEGAADGRPRQAFFARAGAGMIATYASLALNSHGPSFALSGDGRSVGFALEMANCLVQNGQCNQAIVIAADYDGDQMRAIAISCDRSLPMPMAHRDVLLSQACPSAVMEAWVALIDSDNNMANI